ncbi:MAG: hypothetical protein HN607_12385 [Verrucomicrobia bacterium]|nr:hypothetical protein [Verrucomicrobiota bacterium]
MNLPGQTAEAVAALALVREGFEVSAPIFTSPAFDLVAKWGRAIHAIQVKTGCVSANGKTVQWHTTKSAGGLYAEGDCSYFGLVLIPHNEVWWVPIEEVIGKRSVCTNIEHDSLAEYRGSLDSLKV